MRIALVAARFNQGITDAMVRRARERIDDRGHTHADTLRVPGAFDTPLAAQHCLARESVDGVVVIGAVVTGETDHDQILMQSTAKTLQELSLRFDKPVGFAITGPGMSQEQAQARVDYAAAGVDAVLELEASLTGSDPGFEPVSGSH